MHVRHELQPVLNLKHQRRERAVQPFRLVELLQRLPVLASALRYVVGSAAVAGLDGGFALSGVLKRSSRTPPTRNDIGCRGSVRPCGDQCEWAAGSL